MINNSGCFPLANLLGVPRHLGLSSIFHERFRKILTVRDVLISDVYVVISRISATKVFLLQVYPGLLDLTYCDD